MSRVRINQQTRPSPWPLGAQGLGEKTHTISRQAATPGKAAERWRAGSLVRADGQCLLGPPRLSLTQPRPREWMGRQAPFWATQGGTNPTSSPSKGVGVFLLQAGPLEPSAESRTEEQGLP